MMKVVMSLCGLSVLLSCTSTASSARRMPEAQLVSVSYSDRGMMAYPNFDYRMQREADGSVWCLAFSHESCAYEKYSVDSSRLDSACCIIRDHKMYAYKDRYSPMLEVLDGNSWGFSAAFADGSYLSSSGNNAEPNNGGLSALRQFFGRAVAGGQFLYRTDEDGRQIPAVP